MRDRRKIKQLIPESRHILALICDEGCRFQRELPVFAWVIFEDDEIEPLFLHKDFQVDARPYGVEMIRRITKRDVKVISYDMMAK